MLVSPISAPGTNMNSAGGGRLRKFIESRLSMAFAGSGGGRWSGSTANGVRLLATGSLGGSGALLGDWLRLLLPLLLFLPRGISGGAGDPLPDSVRFTGRRTDFQFMRPLLVSSSECCSSLAPSAGTSILLPNGGGWEEPFSNPVPW